MLFKAPHILLLYPIKGMKHFISNVCLSLQYIVPFLVLIGYPPYLVFCVKFESRPQQKRHGVNNAGLVYAIRSSSHLFYTSEEG